MSKSTKGLQWSKKKGLQWLGYHPQTPQMSTSAGHPSQTLSSRGDPKPAVSEPRPLEAQGEPAADDKSVAKDQSEKKEDHPDGFVRLAFAMHILLSNLRSSLSGLVMCCCCGRHRQWHLLSEGPCCRQYCLKSMFWCYFHRPPTPPRPMASSQAGFLFCAICLHPYKFWNCSLGGSSLQPSAAQGKPASRDNMGGKDGQPFFSVFLLPRLHAFELCLHFQDFMYPNTGHWGHVWWLASYFLLSFGSLLAFAFFSKSFLVVPLLRCNEWSGP